MSAEKTEDVRAPPQAVPPYEYNGNYAPTPIEPDYAAQPVQPVPVPVQPQSHSQYPTAVPLYALQRTPAAVDCPSCHQREMTRVEFASGGTTHGWAALLCLCFCLGCIPYMISSLKDTQHYCGRCNKLLAKWHNSGRVEVFDGPQPPRKK